MRLWIVQIDGRTGLAKARSLEEPCYSICAQGLGDTMAGGYELLASEECPEARGEGWLARATCVNLLGRWPGKASKGDLFPAAEGRAARMLLRMIGEGVRRAVLLGRNVATAFGLRAGFLER